MDYSEYHLTGKEKWLLYLKAGAWSGLLAWLLYRSVFGILLFPAIVWLLMKEAKRDALDARKDRLQREFVQGISVLNQSLQAGLSMENAWREVERETRVLYGEGSDFYREIKEINRMVAHNVPLERLFLEFAYRCKVEDMIQFAELLLYGKRSGGNWKKIIDATVNRIAERYDARQQIEVMVAEKNMEQKIMNVMPLGILAFLQVFAADYMSVLYHNWLGVICMTLFAALYVLAIMISQEILKVEV